MKIDQEALRRIAHLARLEIKESEEAALLSSLTEVLTWMEQLNELDTTGVEPLTHLSEAIGGLRDDVAKETLTHEQALVNAPKRDDDYFRVPKVLE
ncbi:MAG: Asp-tRNA(Asn)/Glu-tRNA(Gln) amidotransferase subunit GatC [Sphingobacteriaceae bacterium]|nr:Asp-tRNA(Asn)/Glu-tRNA(Gln) amidotransferase subunit GatC [Cytophagaceae bacterium]